MSAAGVNTLTITPPLGQAPGSYPFTIQAVNGSATRTLSASVVVTSSSDFWLTTIPRTLTVGQGFDAVFNIGVSPFNGFNQAVNFSVSGLPAGSSYTLASALPGSSTILKISGAAQGTYPITISGTAGTLTRTVSAVLVVNSSDFAVSVTPYATQSVLVGDTNIYAVTVGAVGGFTGIVDLTVSGLPQGGTYTLSPPSIAGPGPVMLYVATDLSQTPPQNYTITTTGASGSVVRSGVAPLQVTNYSMVASPNSMTVKKGNTVTSNVTIANINGFTNGVFLVAQNVPPGLTVTFAPQSLNNGATSVMSVKAANNMTPGSYTFLVDGTFGQYDRLTTVMVNVTN
jgi:hypothetical protein